VRIAVCDDEKAARLCMRKALGASEALPSKATVAEFSDGKSLIESHKENPYNVIFLDIEMPGYSGLDTGREIRSIDKDAIIIFVTNHEQYASQSIEKIVPFDFIKKPFGEKKISDALNSAMAQYTEQRYLVGIRGSDSAKSIVISKIVFLEAHGGSLHFVAVDKKDSCYCQGTLNEYESRLSEHGFLRCHHKNMVNMRYIDRIEKSSIVTTFGQKLDMSVRKKKDCLRIYSIFRTRHMV